MPNVVAPLPRFPDDWPALGLGCAPLGDLFEPIAERHAAELLDAAWTAGIRLYDTAPWYGHGLSEHRLGALLRQHDRGAAIVSTKVGRIYTPAPRDADARVRWAGGLNFAVTYDYSAEGFARSFAQSTLRLGVPSLDALVIHDLDRPYHGAAFDGHLDALSASGLEYLNARKRSGDIAAIGMGTNRAEEFDHFSEAIDVDFFLVAMPYTLLDQSPLFGAMARCEARGIKIVIGAPFASGLLTNPSAPSARYGYAPASPSIRQKALAIEAHCARHGVSLGAAALQFPLMHPAVVAVIPGANAAAHVRQNAAAMGERIPPALWADLKRDGLLTEAAPTS